MNDTTIIDTPDQPSLIMTPMPMRSAEEQWNCAGLQSQVYATLEAEGIVFVEGKGGRCVMRQDQWAAYQSRCLQGAPSVSMLEATRDEDEIFPDGLKPELRTLQPSHFARAFNVMEALLLAHEKSLDEEDREEMLRRLAGQMASLKVAVLRAEEIWREEHPAAETVRDALEQMQVDRDYQAERANEAQTIRERLAYELMQERIENRQLRNDVAELNERLQERVRDYLSTMKGVRAENMRLRMILEMKAAAEKFGEISKGLKTCEAALVVLHQDLKGGPDAA